MSSYIHRFCFGFNLMMFVCRGKAGLSRSCGECVHKQSVGEGRNA